VAVRDVFVAGIGMTRFAKQPERGLNDLTGEAAGAALAEAGLAPAQLDAAYFANAIGTSMTGQEMVAGQVALRHGIGLAGVPVINVENACASASTALHLGWQAVASGVADRVLCVGAEKMTHPDKERAFVAIARAVDVDEVFGPEGPQPGGRSYFMDVYAGEAREYLERTHGGREMFAAVAVKNHANGARNPLAQYGSELTIEDVLAAREIVWPLTLPMCSPISDGAAAVVLAGEDALGGRALPRVRVAASVVASGLAPGDPAGNATAKAASRAYELAGLGPDDLDLVELHDATASAEVELYESLGLAEPGEGGRLALGGETARDGRIPVNVSGGLLAKGHPVGATGLAQVYEATLHLQGRAGERQVEGARRALTHNAGGWLQGDNAVAAVHIFERVDGS
jgi:acetyl-CoA acetyltransferase